MTRSHKYIRKYRNSNGNWTYVYDEPKGQDRTTRTNSGIDNVTWSGYHDYTYLMSDNPSWSLTARDKAYEYVPGSSRRVFRRGEGLGSGLASHTYSKEQMYKARQIVDWIRKRREEEAKEKRENNPYANRKKADVRRRYAANMVRRINQELAERKERERNLPYHIRRKVTDAKKQVHYLDPEQEAWAKVFREYEGKAKHEQSRRAKSGGNRRTTK